MGVIRSLFSDWSSGALDRASFLLATVALLPFTLLLAVIGTNISGRIALADTFAVPIPWGVMLVGGAISVPVYLVKLNISAKRAFDIGLPPLLTSIVAVAGPGVLAALGLGGVSMLAGLAALAALLLLPTNAARGKAN